MKFWSPVLRALLRLVRHAVVRRTISEVLLNSIGFQVHKGSFVMAYSCLIDV